jgi:hypothetical protein
MYSAVPQDRVAYFVWRAADKLERNTKGSGAARFAGVGPQEPPYYTNQPTRTKTDRVLSKYFFASTQFM